MSDKKTEDTSNKQTRPSETTNTKKRDDKAKTKAKELDKKAKLLKAKEFRESNVESDFNSDLVADKSWHSAQAQVTPEEILSQGESAESTTESPESTPALRGKEADVDDINSLVDANDSQVEPTANKDLGTHRGGHHIAVDVKEPVVGGNDPLKYTAGNNFKSTLVAHSDHNKAELHHSPVSNHSANHTSQANTVVQHSLVINHLPPAQSVKEDASVNTVDGRLTASGDGSQSVSWSVASTHGKYGDLQLDSKTGEWHYHLDNSLVDTDQLGEGEVHTEHFTVTATDKFGHVIQTQVNVNVQGTNDAPTVTHAAADHMVDQGSTLQFALPADTFNDIDHGDTLTLTTGTLPAWLHFDASTGTFSGTPSNSDVGQTNITVTATDTAGAQVSTTFDLTVNNVNDAPVLTPMATVQVDEDGATASGQVHATDIDTGDTLTFSAGQVDGLTFHSDGHWSFDPSHTAYQHLAVGETLPLTIPVTVTDSHGASDVQQLNIVVTGTNDAPVVTSSITLPEGSEDNSVLISESSLLANASDIDSGETHQLTVHHLHADHGAIVDNHDGTFTFNPDANYNGRVTFTYDVEDPQGATVATSATMDLKAVGDAAIITGQDTGHVTEDLYDATLTQNLKAWGQLTVTDPDKGEAGFVEHITGLARFAKPDFIPGQYGRVEISEDGHWTYEVPNSHPDVQSLGVGQHLTDHIEVESLDGTKHTITITIEGTNDAPTVAHAVVDQTIDQGGALQFTLPADTFNDIDHGDTLTLSTGTLPAWLHFDASTGTFSGTPSNSDVGQTNITVTATDPAGAQVSTTFDLTVNNVNDAPVLTPMATVQVDEDGATASGQVHATDIDTGDSLTFSAGQVDGLTFHSDGHWTFDPSHAAYQHLAVGETLPLSIPVTVTDSHGASDVQQLNIVVTGTNDAPVVTSSITLPEGSEDNSVLISESSLLANASDIDSGETHQLTVHHLHADHGAIVDNHDGTFTFNPDANYNGRVTFTYDVQDPQGATVATSATMDLKAVGDAAIITGQDTGLVTEDLYDATLTQNLKAWGQLTVTDPDKGEAGFVEHITGLARFAKPDFIPGQYGRVEISEDGHWTYEVPNSHPDVQSLGVGQHLTDHIEVESLDGTKHTITITIEGTNDAPTVAHAVVDQTIDQGGALQFTLPADTFNDIDHGDTLTLSTGTLPAWLHFDASTGTFSGTPSNSDVGQTSITVTATDTAGAQVSTTFDLTVNNVNDAPVLTPMATVQVDEDGATASGQVHATDIDTGDSLTFSAGQVDGLTFHSDGHWSFDPSHTAYQHLAVGETLPLSIPVTVTDSHGASDVQQLNIVVTGTNDAPVVTSSITLPEGSEDNSVLISESSLLANASDIDSGETHQLTVHHLHADHGAIVDNHDGTFTFNPDANYNGRVTFTYDVQDPQGATVATSATMDLKAVGDAAIITGQDTGLVTEDLYDATLTQNLKAWGQLTVTDPDKGEAGFVEHITGLARFAKPDFIPGQYGRVEISEDGHWTYEVPNSHPDVQSLGVGQHLTDHIEVESLDGTKHTITITIEGTNDAPTVAHAVVDQTIDQGGALQFALPADTFNDIDHGDTLTLSTGTLPAWLHFDASTGTFSGTPTNSDVGQANITVTATDTAGAQVSTTFDLTVNNLNDAPVLTPMATVKVDEDGALAQGQVHATDIDTGDSLTFSAGQVDGLTFHSDGHWTFDPSHAAYQHLAVGETLPLSIPVTVTDSHGATDVQQLNIVVTGTNDAPILSIQPVDNTSGHLTETDVDSSDTHQFSVVQSSGSFGDLIVNSQTGEYDYVPRSSVVGMSYDSTTNTYSGSDVFEVRVTDNHGAESIKYITFDVQSALTPSSTTAYQVHSHVIAPPQLSAVSPNVHTSSLPLTNNVTLDLDMTSDTGVSDHDHLTHDNTPTVHGTSEIPFSVIEIHEGNSLVAKVVSDSAGHYQVDLPHMVDAAHSLSAIAVSPSSISGTSAPLDLTVDTQSDVHVNPIAGDNIIDTVEHGHLLTIDGTANGIEDGQIVTVSIGGNNHQAVISNGLWSVDIDATEVQSLKGGLHDVLVSSEDRAGNAVSSNNPLFVSDSSTPVPSMNFQTPPKPTSGGAIGSHISGTILVPPLLQQLNPPASGSGGWGIDDGHGHTVTSLHGAYGTLTIDPATGHVDYIYNTAPVQGAKTSGGTHVAGQTTTEEHHDIFKVVYHDVHASDIDVKVDLDVTYIHGHSGQNQISTHLMDMTLTPASISPAPPVQHDEALQEDVVDEFTVDILEDSNGMADSSDMNGLVDGVNHQSAHQMKPIDHYLDMVGVPDSQVSTSDDQFSGYSLPIVEDIIDHSLDDVSSHSAGESAHDPLLDSIDDHHHDRNLPDELDDHQSDTSQSDDLLHQGINDMHNHI